MDTFKLDAQAQATKSKSLGRHHIIASSRTWIESDAVSQLQKTAELEGMVAAIGMPDIHPGRGTPIGAAFISQACIYPHLVGNDIGCGMSFYVLDQNEKKAKFEKWEKKLRGLDEAWSGDVQAYVEQERLSRAPAGLKIETHNLGTIGGGNHFAEFQKVEAVFDEFTFLASGFDRGAVYLLVHSGSRGLGQQILRDHLDRFGARSLRQKDPEFHSYIEKHNYALVWAEANRKLIALRFMAAVSSEGDRKIDINHNTVLPYSYMSDIGEQAEEASSFWIHRKGASPADMGLVVIPGSRGSLSYLVKPRVDDNKLALTDGAFSLAHGAGRKWKRSDAKGRLENRYKVADLENTKLGGRVVCKKRDLLYEEAPQAYKNIDHVIGDLVQFGMIEIIATFRPVLSYKTRRT